MRGMARPEQKSPDARDLIEALGGKAIAAALGVSASSVKEAKRNNLFPASWYRGVTRLGQSKGVTVPLDAFNWRGAA